MRQMEPHVKWHFFRRKVIFSISDVPEWSKESICRFPANFKEISESQIFHLSRDQTSHRAKISHFQNMLGFIQYGSRLFCIDPSSDPAKFQDDWPSILTSLLRDVYPRSRKGHQMSDHLDGE